MSSYNRAAYHPPTNTVRTAYWQDDYFGRHQYGVMFAIDEKVYRPDEVIIPLDKVFVEESHEDVEVHAD